MNDVGGKSFRLCQVLHSAETVGELDVLMVVATEYYAVRNLREG